MSSVPVTLIFADGASCTLPVEPGENIVTAADTAGFSLLTDCREGRCATCMGQLLSGSVELGDYDEGTLDDEDRAAGKILTCVARVQQHACVIEFPYDFAEVSEPVPSLAGRLVAVEPVAAEALRVEIDVDEPLDFLPGQYVRLRPDGADFQRSFSMANAPGATRLVFFIRTVPGGQFSTWTTEQARPGAAVEVSRPHGTFFLRTEARPRLFVAGGTGLAPFLSMLETLAANLVQAAAAPVTDLLVGARTPEHLFALDAVEALAARVPNLRVQFLVDETEDQRFRRGRAMDVLAELGLDSRTRVYLCGPPPMVDAGRQAAVALGVSRDDVLCECFT
jgi:benzoate/toluate 1,2-dioxygenase reductase component